MRFQLHSHLEPDERLKWDSFWENCRHAHARQHSIFGEVERAKGRVPIYGYGEVGGTIVCAGLFSICPLFRAKMFSFEAICQRGPAFDVPANGEAFLQEVTDRFKTMRVGAIRVSPYWYFPEAEQVVSILRRLGFVPYRGITKTSTGLIDLTRDEDRIFSSFERKTRQQIKAAEKYGVQIHAVTDPNEGIEAFGHLRSMQTERGIQPVPAKEFAGIFQHILRTKDRGILLNAKVEQAFLGALWNLRSNHISNPSGYVVKPGSVGGLPSSFTIGPTLWWEMMRWAKSRGCSFFDVEGNVSKGDPASPTYYVSQFKRRFSPEPVELLNQHVYVCDRAVHFLSEQRENFRSAFRRIVGLPYRIRKWHTRVASNVDSQSEANHIGEQQRLSKNKNLGSLS